MIFGALGFQLVFPTARIATVEAAQAKEVGDRVRGDSVSLIETKAVAESLREHLEWAQSQDNLLVGLLKLKCLEGWVSPLQRGLLQAAGIPCSDLLGNKVPAR